MLISRRKRKEVKEIKVYLNNKPLEQVTTMKYLGIIIDNKFQFSEHINYAAERCTKLIHSLSKSAKVSWELKHEELKTIYKGAIIFLLYGAPVWIEATKHEYSRRNYIRVQGLLNIRVAKAFRKISSEALCILAGMTSTFIKTEEAVKQYNITKGKGTQTHLFDSRVEFKNWPHLADAVKIIEAKEYKKQTIQAYTDGSKNEHGVRSGVAIVVGKVLAAQLTL
jgi:hypothetical protein